MTPTAAELRQNLRTIFGPGRPAGLLERLTRAEVYAFNRWRTGGAGLWHDPAAATNRRQKAHPEYRGAV